MRLTDRATKLSPWEVTDMVKPVSTIADECKRVESEISTDSKRKAMFTKNIEDIVSLNRRVEVF